MTTKKRMTPDEWQAVRERWEADPRTGYTWILNEMNLSVSHVAVFKRARKEGWAKKASLKTIVARAQARADAGGNVTPVTDSEAVAVRAEIIDTHRKEWGDHRAKFALDDMLVTFKDNGEIERDGFAVARSAKAAAETIRLRQDGERRAWGLDAITEEVSTGSRTLEELDAFFALAVRRAGEQQEAIRRERAAAGLTQLAGDETA